MSHVRPGFPLGTRGSDFGMKISEHEPLRGKLLRPVRGKIGTSHGGLDPIVGSPFRSAIEPVAHHHVDPAIAFPGQG